MVSTALRISLSKLLAWSQPVLQWRRPHEVHCPHDAVAHPQQVEGGLGVFELGEGRHCPRQPLHELLLHELGVEFHTSQRHA